jgi:hypothetical protein
MGPNPSQRWCVCHAPDSGPPHEKPQNKNYLSDPLEFLKEDLIIKVQDHREPAPPAPFLSRAAPVSEVGA